MLRRLTPRLLLCLGLVVAASPARAELFQVTPIGNPTFDLVDFHMFTHAFSGPDMTFQDFFDTLPQILPEPYYHFDPSLGYTHPAAPRPGPYDKDIANGMAALGWTDQNVFKPSDWQNPNGIYIAYMIVPNGSKTGSSTDSPNGAIIPKGIKGVGTLSHNGVVFDTFNSFEVPDPGDEYDGWSHYPIDIGDNEFFAPPGQLAEGFYRFTSQVLDADGNGYQVNGEWTVTAETPEPASMILCGLGMGGVGLVGFGKWVRRRRSLPT